SEQGKVICRMFPAGHRYAVGRNGQPDNCFVLRSYIRQCQRAAIFGFSHQSYKRSPDKIYNSFHAHLSAAGRYCRNARKTLRVMSEVSDWYPSPDKVAVHPIEPTLKTRPPRGHSKRTMSERTAGLVSPPLHGVFNSVSSMTLW